MKWEDILDDKTEKVIFEEKKMFGENSVIFWTISKNPAYKAQEHTDNIHNWGKTWTGDAVERISFFVEYECKFRDF